MTQEPKQPKENLSGSAKPTPSRYPLDPLVDVMARLRSDDGCPWDREQDHRSLKKYLIEEAYEVLDAIDSQDDLGLVEELGDVLLQVVFHAQIASETGRFDANDVVARITDKLVRRHPHVFGGDDAPDAATVLRKWEQSKQEEKKAAGKAAASLLDGIPRHLPALMYAFEVQKRAAKVGFEWDEVAGALEKVEEEIGEIRRAAESGDRAELEAEWGDLFFALVNAARYMDVEPEEALRSATRRFESRFRYIEEQAAARSKDLSSMDLEEMDALWDQAKEKEQGK